MERPTQQDSVSSSDDTVKLPVIRLGRHFEMHAVVFPAAAVVLLTLVAICFIFPKDRLLTSFTELRDSISATVGWLYVGAMSGFLMFAACLALGPYRHVRLGPQDGKPEFGVLSWFAMLFSAGMGIGLVFYGVAEPVDHFLNPPPGYSVRGGPLRLSMATTIFHWGLHPWGLYAIVGLCLAYFSFRQGKPLSFRSVLEPLFGRRVWGLTGDLIDLLAIVATLTGVATSLGIGAQQVNSGLSFLFSIDESVSTQVMLIAAITAVATISVVLGLDAGIRRLSEINMLMAASLLVMVAIGGGAIAFSVACFSNTWAYLQILPKGSITTGLFDQTSSSWVNGWTVFFWAWWIAWSPFVGLFIARVSKGRTIQEYIIGVLAVPTLIAIVWLTAFGDTTLRQHIQSQNQSRTSLPNYPVAVTDNDGTPVQDDDGKYLSQQKSLSVVEYRASQIVSDDGTSLVDSLPTVLFVLMDGIFQSKVLATVGTGIAIVCIVLFFVTSSDSASMVIDIIASGGNSDPPVGTRLFWAITEGVVAVALLTAGGLGALQAASITAALPFTVILILCCISLVKALQSQERRGGRADQVDPPEAVDRSTSHQ